jgi:hypothetical protein
MNMRMLRLVLIRAITGSALVRFFYLQITQINK